MDLRKFKKYKKYVEIGSYPFFQQGKIGVSIVIRTAKKNNLQSCHKDIVNFLKNKKLELLGEYNVIFAFGVIFIQTNEKKVRNSKYLGCYSLNGYKLVFRNFFLGGGVADVEKKNNSSVLGALYKISKKDEKELDIYEDYPNTYIKNILSYMVKR